MERDRAIVAVAGLKAKRETIRKPPLGTQPGEIAEPVVIDYLRTPPTREQVMRLVSEAGLTLRAALRQKDMPYEALSLGDPALTDQDLLDAIAAHPVLLNRPFVVTPRGVRLCRPSELVLDILLNPDIGPFTKEDGEVVMNAVGRRVVP